ncbi:MAG: retron St85 family effector protein [Gammaproteobacteria bacterium]
MIDPRDSFVAAIDLSSARVEHFPGLIFFCGGPIESEAMAGSLRDYFLRWLGVNDEAMASRVVIAEKINHWMKDDTYKELFTLEQHVAELASTIVIFLESPGAIAELGAFSALGGVQDKLLVFVREDHYKADSFIRLGPIDFLQGRDQQSVAVYPWRITSDQGIDRLDEPSVAECVAEMHKNLMGAAGRVSRLFVPSEARDRMLLIADLVGHMVALTKAEIDTYVAQLGITIEAADMKKYLFVLEKLGLIRQVTRGHSRYYVASNEGQTYLRWQYRDGADSYDRLRLNFAVSEFYKAKDQQRSKAVARALAGLT